MKTILLLIAIFAGVFFPFNHAYAYLIKYLLMVMLFFSFLQMEIKRDDIKGSHFRILLINIIVPVVTYVILRPFDLQLAQIVFITAIAPTAIATPVIVNLLKGRMEYTVVSILITNFSVAFLLPFLLPIVMNHTSDITVMDVMKPVASVFLIPFFIALFLKKIMPIAGKKLAGLGKYMFYILVVNINLGTANASQYIREEMGFSHLIIYLIAAASLLLCIAYFNLGRRIVPQSLKIEGAQSLGQKNNGFTLWVALTFMSPLAAVGPVFYILFQNLYISWKLHRNDQ
jgi:BASS family bile acid:Na+ symporter